MLQETNIISIYKANITAQNVGNHALFLQYDYWYFWTYTPNMISAYGTGNGYLYSCRTTNYGKLYFRTVSSCRKNMFQKYSCTLYFPSCRSPIEQLKGWNKYDDDEY
jgi:hypothetical protein